MIFFFIREDEIKVKRLCRSLTRNTGETDIFTPKICADGQERIKHKTKLALFLSGLHSPVNQ